MYLASQKIKNTMEATIKTRRKVIDIKPDTYQGLSIIAAKRGTNLKHLIEISLDELVDTYEDSMLYTHLCKTDPEGLEMVSNEEKLAFEKRLGL
jgi:hypothetical protein